MSQWPMPLRLGHPYWRDIFTTNYSEWPPEVLGTTYSIHVLGTGICLLIGVWDCQTTGCDAPWITLGSPE